MCEGRAKVAAVRRRLAEQGHRRSKMLVARAEMDAVRRPPPSEKTLMAVLCRDHWGEMAWRYALRAVLWGRKYAWELLYVMGVLEVGRMALEKIEDLFGPSDQTLRDRIREAVTRGKKIELDWKEQAEKLIRALGLGEDDHIVVFAKGRKKIRWEMTVKELMDRQWAFLRHLNAHGANIYWGPTSQPLIILDVDKDTKTALKRLIEDIGVWPNAIVETSRGHFQVWIRCPDDLSREQLSAVQRWLTDRTGADPGAKGYPRLARLPGFTNRKYKWRDGRHPWVRLRWWATDDYKSKLKESSIEIRKIVDALMPSDHTIEKPFRLLPGLTGVPAVYHRAMGVIYRRIAGVVGRTVPRRQDGSVDLSALDFRVAAFLRQRGIPKGLVSQVLRGSPDLLNRHRNVSDYINRTIEAADRYKNEPREPEDWVKRALDQPGPGDDLLE